MKKIGSKINQHFLLHLLKAYHLNHKSFFGFHNLVNQIFIIEYWHASFSRTKYKT